MEKGDTEDLLFEVSDDVNRYLNIKELTTVSTVSTNTFFRGLNNMKFYRYFPYENGEEILRTLENKEEVKLSDIKGSSNLNFGDKFGWTPLDLAVKNNNIKMVKLLIKEGADVNMSEVTPLHYAVEDNNIKIVKFLIKEGANINAIARHIRDTPLHRAVGSNKIEVVKLLIEEGANVNIADIRGITPLLYAVYNDNGTEISELLINSGANVNSVDEDWWTPLRLAVKYDNTEMIELLVGAGAL